MLESHPQQHEQEDSLLVKMEAKTLVSLNSLISSAMWLFPDKFLAYFFFYFKKLKVLLFLKTYAT